MVLLWNLGGPVQVDAGGGSVQMKKDDVLSLMPHRSWTVQGQKILLAAFVLDDAQLRACFPRRNYSIRCNSAQEVNDNYDLLRKALGQTLQVWAEQGIYLEAQLNRLYYELLILLVNHFSVNMPGTPKCSSTPCKKVLQPIPVPRKRIFALRSISRPHGDCRAQGVSNRSCLAVNAAAPSPKAATECVGCQERTTPGRCRNISVRSPTIEGVSITENTGFSAFSE